ncbi:MAG: hypothetical protein ACQESG_04610 [Nanobdellota archaeon]
MIAAIAIETIYLLLVLTACFYISWRVYRLYAFSHHEGLKYLGLAFLFFGLGFVIRYGLMLGRIIRGESTLITFGLFTILMEFLLVLPGLFLTYSLTWRKIPNQNLLHAGIYILALIVAVGDFLLSEFYLLYGSQIILFLVASVVSLSKYMKRRSNYLQLYFITLVLFFLVWVFNAIAQYTIPGHPYMRLYAYLLTISACFIFVYVTRALTRGFK